MLRNNSEFLLILFILLSIYGRTDTFMVAHFCIFSLFYGQLNIFLHINCTSQFPISVNFCHITGNFCCTFNSSSVSIDHTTPGYLLDCLTYCLVT